MRDAKISFNFKKLQKTRRANNNSGITLVELLISIAILGIIMTGLYQALGISISSYGHIQEKHDLLAQARYAMDRMVMFVQETDSINIPQADKLDISERVLDAYNNTTHAYAPDGDGYLDADNDADGLVNEGGPEDIQEILSFTLDKTVSGNWKLEEKLPDYSTATINDHMARQVLCEHVTDFTCTLQGTNLLEIELTLNDGKVEVTLKTRVKALYVN